MSTTGKRRRGPGRPPKAEAGDTKAELIDVALKLFAERGYVGTSIRAIAREIGLSESVLYAHFANKQAIYDAAMKIVGPQVAITALDVAPSDCDPADFIHRRARPAPVAARRRVTGTPSGGARARDQARHLFARAVTVV